MSDDVIEPKEMRLVFDGHAMEARPGTSLLQAWSAAGSPTENVECLGQGVYGACRVLVQRQGERLAGTISHLRAGGAADAVNAPHDQSGRVPGWLVIPAARTSISRGSKACRRASSRTAVSI
jgi:hypothetical protein